MAGKNKGRNSDREVVATEIKVLFAILTYVDEHEFPSYRELGYDLGLSVYRVTSAIKRLESDGFLEVDPRYNEFGGRTSNGFVITDLGYRLLDRVDQTLYEARKDVLQGK